jgi:hypothetical protein
MMKSRLVRRVAVLAAGTGVFLFGPALAAPTGNLLQDVPYYTVTNPTSHPGGFCRSTAPSTVSLATGGTDSQSRNPAGNGPVGLTINGATTYTDDGFYKPAGTLGNLAGYTISGTGDSFGDNLWFDTNTLDDANPNGPYFMWNGGSPDCLTTLGGDTYGLGPASAARGSHGQTVTVNDSSSFFMQVGNACSGRSVTLAQLKAGACLPITSSTPVAVWIGITTGTGGSLNTRITSAHTAG